MKTPATPAGEQGRLEIQGPWVADYRLRTPPGLLARPAHAYVLLHGYGLNAEWIFGKLAGALPADAAVVALNGPFPIPERAQRPRGTEDRRSEWRIGFSWYFYDASTDEYFIDMRVGAAFVRGALEALGLGDTPKTLIGFSQGGYLAPFAARELAGVARVIGVAAQFLDEELTGRLGFRCDAVHGLDDDVVAPAGAEAAIRRLAARGEQAEWHPVPGAGHRFTPGMVERVAGLVAAG
jgi:predicted esterase